MDGKGDIMDQQDFQQVHPEVQEIKDVEEDMAVGELPAERLLLDQQLSRLLPQASLRRALRR